MSEARVLAPLNWRAIRLALVLLAALMGVVVVVLLLVTSDGDQIQPRLNGYRNYKNAPLQRVIEDLEVHHVIPEGTVWESDDLKSRLVTVRWLLPTAPDALRSAAESSDVEIVCLVRGVHGLLRGPIRVQHASKRGAGVRAYGPGESGDSQ